MEWKKLFIEKDNSGNYKKTKQLFDWVGVMVLVSAAFLVIGFLLFQVDQQGKINQAKLLNDYLYQEEFLYHYKVKKSDSTPEKTYAELLDALEAEDIERVLATIHPDALWKYEDDLRDSNKDNNLSIILDRLTPLDEKIYDDGEGVVTYIIEDIEEDEDSEVSFARDKEGFWKINSI